MNQLYRLICCGTLLLCQIISAAELTDVDISIKYDGSFGYDLILNNRSDYFVCVANDNINTYGRLLTIKDEHGKTLIPQTFTDTGPYDTELGFDFVDSYFILRPDQKRLFHLDLTNFLIHEGKYHYSLKVPVFKCKDVVDDLRVKDNREVKPVLIEKEGSIKFGKEFIKLNDQIRDQKTDDR